MVNIERLAKSEQQRATRPALALRTFRPRCSSVHIAHRAALASPLVLEHGHLCHLQRAIAVHRSRYLYVMSNVALHGIGICDVDDLLVLVRHEHRLLARADTLLRAGGMRGVGALGAAL